MKRLMRLIESDAQQNVDDDQTNVVEPTVSLPVLGEACGNCRGGCCQRGGTAAYLDQRVVRRFRKRNPDLSLWEMLKQYCALLPAESYSGSCVFHAETGCTLPREFRSNTCNLTACAGLIELQNRITLDKEQKFILVAIKKQTVVRSRFVESE